MKKNNRSVSSPLFRMLFCLVCFLYPLFAISAQEEKTEASEVTDEEDIVLLKEIEILKILSTHETESGLKYEINKEGSGPIATTGKPVVVHYTGWLDNNGKKGKKFDSSRDRGESFLFYLGKKQVIKGWEEGIEGMKIGERRTLYIPAHLAYGAEGAEKSIPPNADLIFDVELLDVY